MAEFTNVIIKRPGHDKPLNKEEEEEWIKCAQDFYYFANNYVFVQNKYYGRMLFETRSYQERLIDTVEDNKYTVSIFPRQRGKCLEKDSNINIRNKRTGEVQSVTIEEFYKLCKHRKETENS